MEAIKTYYGYKIKHNNRYYAGIKAGRAVWVNDYTYGKAYKKKTTDKIISRIKAEKDGK